MKKEPIQRRLPMFISLPIVYCVGVPLFYALGWWSENVNGVEPKTGQPRYHYKSNGSVRFRKRVGLRYAFTKWQPYAYASHIGLRFQHPQKKS